MAAGKIAAAMQYGATFGGSVEKTGATRVKTSMPKRSARKKATTIGAKRHLGRKTVRSSSRTRAAQAKQSDKVLPGKRKKVARSVIDADSDQEVFGVLLSERRRMGESNPTVPEKKTKHTRTIEPKHVPKTGIAKSRKRS
jgi:hypothetical protein